MSAHGILKNDSRFVVVLEAGGDRLAGAVVVVINSLVPSGLGEECAVVVAVGGSHAVYDVVACYGFICPWIRHVIRADKPPDLRVIVPGVQVVESGLFVLPFMARTFTYSDCALSTLISINLILGFCQCSKYSNLSIVQTIIYQN